MELQCQIHEAKLKDSVYNQTSCKRPSKMQRLSAGRLREIGSLPRIELQGVSSVPWVPETFSSAVSGFCQVFIVTLARVRPTAEDVSAFGQHRKFPLHARKTSGTQGISSEKRSRHIYFMDDIYCM